METCQILRGEIVIFRIGIVHQDREFLVNQEKFYSSIPFDSDHKSDNFKENVYSMLFRTVPKTGDELSILGFGFMRLPLKKEAGLMKNVRSGNCGMPSTRELIMSIQLPHTILAKVRKYLHGHLQTDTGKKSGLRQNSRHGRSIRRRT